MRIVIDSNVFISSFFWGGHPREIFDRVLNGLDELFITKSSPKPVSRDKDDDKIVQCGLDGKVDFIITGDKDLLVLKEYETLKIMTPKNYLKIWITSTSTRGRSLPRAIPLPPRGKSFLTWLSMSATASWQRPKFWGIGNLGCTVLGIRSKLAAAVASPGSPAYSSLGAYPYSSLGVPPYFSLGAYPYSSLGVSPYFSLGAYPYSSLGVSPYSSLE